MKIKSNSVFLTIFLLGFFSLALADEIERLFTMEIEGVDLVFDFAADDLSEEEKAIIVEDYTYVLASTNPSFDESYTARGRPNTGEQFGGGIALRKFSYQGPISMPVEWADEFGLWGTTKEGNIKLFISKKLSDRYREAIALTKKHSNAYNDLPEFINTLNDLRQAKMPDLYQILYFPENSNYIQFFKGETQEKTNQKILNYWGRFTYVNPSILNIYLSEGQFSVKAHKYVRENKWQPCLLVFDDERWKIFVPDW